uniref:Uncharacterized protein n=1 Tax=Lepeophtheirus salmonis TaxID=72036 RepID=A0A0K2V103_LEPSM
MIFKLLQIPHLSSTFAGHFPPVRRKSCNGHNRSTPSILHLCLKGVEGQFCL